MASKTIGAGRITFRYREDIGTMMHEMMERDHTDMSGCIRNSIIAAYKPNNSNLLPELCRLCSLMNQVIEESKMSVEAKEYYHIIHCDYKKVTFKPIVYPGFKYIGVSKLVCDSFKELTGIDAELIYNPIAITKKREIKKYNDGKIHILVASRLSKEKGGERIVKLAQMSNDFVIDLYSNRHLFPQLPNIIEHDTKLDLREEMQKADYVAQLSEHEAFGLSVAESLSLGTPVIVTDIPAFREIGCKHGKNAVICDLDMKNVDIEMIKNGLPKFTYKAPKSNWDKYLDNESDYNPKEIVEVELKKNWWDLENNKHYKLSSTNKVKVRREKVSYLESLGIVKIL